MLFPIAAIALLAFFIVRSGGIPGVRPATLRRAAAALGGRVAPIAIVVAALVVLVHGNVWPALCLFGLSLWMLGRAGSREAPKPASAGTTARSAHLDMRIDAATGRMSGRIVAGRRAGLVLDSLDLDTCRTILAECRREDPEGARLLEAYLDRRFAGWRAAADADGDAWARRARATGGMSQQEAYQVLGLGDGAPRDAVVRAHRTLMKTWHPDGGGTAELAARANEARDVLLRRHG